MPTAPFALPPEVPGAEGFDSARDLMKVAEKGKELIQKEEEYPVDFDDYLRMDRRKVRRESGSRDIADAADGFSVADPYELCFALIYLLDAGDDAPWLMKSGSSLMKYVLSMLPWVQPEDNLTDEDWDKYYEGLSFNGTGWIDREPVPDRIDFYHERHKGRNMAQVIYDLCRAIVPTGLHPFEEERKRFIAEGMEEDKARRVAETAELLFLSAFQAKQRPLENEDFLRPSRRRCRRDQAADHPPCF